MKKRILFFIGSMGDGGAQRVVALLTKKFVKEGFLAEIVTYYDIPPSYEIPDSVKFTCIESNTKSKSFFTNLKWFRKYIKNNCDIVVSFLAKFNMFSIISSAFTGKSVIVADRNDPRYVPENRIIRILRNFLYIFADGIVVQTKTNKQYFNSLIQKKCITIYNPVNMGIYKGIACNSKKRAEIVSVGRLIPQKNQDMLIKAFASLKNIFPEYKLIIYGEGDYREHLQNLIKELNLEDAVELPGAVPNVFDKIKEADIFVLSSFYEGMPNALIEAMCLGLPVVSTKVSGATDLIKNRINGILVDINDTNGLKNSLQELIEDQHFKNSLAQKATEINELLSIDIITDQWLNFILTRTTKNK